MCASKSRAVSAKAVVEFRPHQTKGIPVGSVIKCADNSGANTLKVVQVFGFKGRLGRHPEAGVGDKITVTVKRGAFDLRKQPFSAVIVRQRKAFRRPEGTWIQFEDNAAVILTPENEMKGTEIKGIVAREAAERWPRIANVASMMI